MKHIVIFLIIVLAQINLNSQTNAYVIYNSNGKKVSYKKMMKKLNQQDIILFGEQHDNPISHWLQYEVTHDLNTRNNKKLILAAEMIEADNQKALNQYLSEDIDQAGLDTLARLWNNYKTDYKPLVDLAKENGLMFIGTNVPRRYANLVYRKGFDALDTLSVQEKEWIAPLPIEFDPELPTYKDILNMMGDHGTPELVKAQAIKDATMAHFILSNYKTGHILIHYNGSFHSDRYEGILWYLKRQQSDLRYTTISTVSQKDVNKLEKENNRLADFIICVDENMTTTY